MASAPSKNASVEEILASIRQAISNDDARRAIEHHRSDVRGAAAERGPIANVTDVYGNSDAGAGEQGEEPAEEQGEEAGALDQDQDLIEQAIEQALNGVRAEMNGHRPASRMARAASAQEGPAVEATAQRAVPRARVAGGRREIGSPRRALLSTRTETQVSSSFDDLARAMMGGNARKLDEVVESVLRPMLKTWLEGNLPQMVERLVRDEIERVSRGRK